MKVAKMTYVQLYWRFGPLWAVKKKDVRKERVGRPAEQCVVRNAIEAHFTLERLLGARVPFGSRCFCDRQNATRAVTRGNDDSR